MRKPTYTVYFLMDSSHRVHYVGCTKFSIEKRVRVHVTDGLAVGAWIGANPKMKTRAVLRTTDKRLAFKTEADWIRRLRPTGLLLNGLRRKECVEPLAARVNQETRAGIDRVRQRLAAEIPGKRVTTSDAFRVLIIRGLEMNAC